MNAINVCIENAAQLRAMSGDPRFKAIELFKAKRNGHKFKRGQKCRLVGMESFPEFNGEKVKITSVRQDGHHGRAYYIENEKVNETLNWVYEYRLQEISP